MKEKRKIKHACFDLDGTLIDSYKTIYKSTLETLEFLQINEPLQAQEFQKRIGHHFLHIFEELKIPIPDIEHFINIYKSFYFDFIDESVLYPGVRNTLEFLFSKKIPISLLTTKIQDQAEKIIEHFNLRNFFSYIMGRREGTGLKPSPEPLLFICRELNVNPSDTLIVGDSELDIRCGKNAGALTCAAVYGYRSKEVLSAEEPDYIISGISELLDIV
jgi:phosphoglycolate phosphatase/pyrophosphatase PpaX